MCFAPNVIPLYSDCGGVGGFTMDSILPQNGIPFYPKTELCFTLIGGTGGGG